MDYEYAGSASYPRFNSEIREVAKVFGGYQIEGCELVFPEGINPILVEWFNHIYEYFEPDKTSVIWKHISEHPEIREISSQIWDELQTLDEYGEGWRIY